jgi:hypothetical protein
LLKPDGILSGLVRQLEKVPHYVLIPPSKMVTSSVKACSDPSVQSDMAAKLTAIVVMASDQSAISLSPGGTMHYALQVIAVQI